jgi:dTDP-glucose 4,6-dehydratase
MNVLVTGGAGFIGSNFVRYWVQEHPGDSVVAYDALTYAGNRPSLADIEDRISFVHGDVCDREQAMETMRAHAIDTVVHFAAESHNSLAVLDPGRFFRTNVLGTQAMLEAARHGGVSRFHHISTCEVYGDLPLDSDDAFTEDHPYRPRTPYNASKAGADHAVRAYVETYELPATITNCSNNYGPYQFPEKLIPLMILNMLEGKSLPVYGDGRNIRDWIFVEDHDDAVWEIMKRGEAGRSYNIGGENEWENIRLLNRLIELVAEESGKSPAELRGLITHVKDRPGHDRRYAIDCSRIKKELGWKPVSSFDEGLRKTVRWYLANARWYEHVRTGEYKNWIDRNYASR